jgi:hypothetical protein
MHQVSLTTPHRKSSLKPLNILPHLKRDSFHLDSKIPTTKVKVLRVTVEVKLYTRLNMCAMCVERLKDAWIFIVF